MKKCLLIIFLPFVINAQGILLTKGSHGVFGNFAVSTNENSTSTGVSFGYSLLSKVDIGFVYSHGNVPDVNLEVESLSPSLSINFRPENRFGGFVFSVAYLRSEITQKWSDEFYRGSRITQVDGLILGGNIFVPVYNSESVAVFPAIGIVYGFLNSEDSENFTDTRTVNLGAVVKLFQNHLSLLLTPTASIAVDAKDNALSYGIDIGIMYDFFTNRN